MRLDGFCEVPLPGGGSHRHTDPSLAVWAAWSHHGENHDMAWFILLQGNVVVKNPDTEIRRKMWRLAQALNATVRGDEAEFYDEAGQAMAQEFAPAPSDWTIRARCRGWYLGDSDPTDWNIPPQPFARFPVIDQITPRLPKSPMSAAQAAAPLSYWRALLRHIGRHLGWGTAAAGNVPPGRLKRTLVVAIPKGSATPKQWAAIEAARENARRKGVDLVIREE